jgi:3,4-dihydroxy 2-butanone 4-phosphate synthase/GTP cyclohydrolase II
MRQEGRGIGLVNKIRAYRLQQEEGLDTVEANERLGFEPDLREYGIGAQIMVDLGIRQVRLMTNNPRKVVALEGYGLKIVERVPLVVEPNELNARYLDTKRRKMGHMLDEPDA